MINCSKCHGDGQHQSPCPCQDGLCDYCNGAGCVRCNWAGKCKECSGTGVQVKKCQMCQGAGMIADWVDAEDI